MHYVHEKIEESRHNETLAYLMFIVGAIFFIGGLLETATTIENPNWFLFFPYKIAPHAYNLLGLFMVLSGFMLLVLGISSCIYYALDRVFYLDQLKEVNVTNRKELKMRVANRGTKAFAKELMCAHKTNKENGALA